MPKDTDEKDHLYISIPRVLWNDFEVLQQRLLRVGTATVAPDLDGACPLCGEAEPHEEDAACPWRRLSPKDIGKKKNVGIMQFAADFLARSIAEKCEKK